MTAQQIRGRLDELDSHLTFTYEEFCKLSEAERGRRYAELSDEDKFRVRLSMDSGAVRVLCNDCVHYRGCAKCDAFPQGITGEHIDAVEKDKTTPCSEGIHYEPRDK